MVKRVASVTFGSPAFDEPIFPADDEDDSSDLPAKRRPWSPDEDDHLRDLVDLYGIKSWAQIATNLRNRNGKQCRERWRNHLRPQLNKGDWSQDEDVAIWDRVQSMGTKWAQISEQYMPQRTDNDIKNRWNSIIRKTQHPAGRDWKPDENEARAAILGSASRTQVRKSATGGGDAGQRKRQRGLEPSGEAALDGAASDAEEEEVLDADGPSPSLLQAGRKLFASPEVAGEGGAVLQGAEAVEACRMLVGGEITADTFDVDAFLPLAAASMASISQMCSPLGEGKARPLSRCAAADWYDKDLDSTLSPILTPSLGHSWRRALMATPRSLQGITPSALHHLAAADTPSLAGILPPPPSAASALPAAAYAAAAGGLRRSPRRSPRAGTSPLRNANSLDAMDALVELSHSPLPEKLLEGVAEARRSPRRSPRRAAPQAAGSMAPPAGPSADAEPIGVVTRRSRGQSPLKPSAPLALAAAAVSKIFNLGNLGA